MANKTIILLVFLASPATILGMGPKGGAGGNISPNADLTVSSFTVKNRLTVGEAVEDDTEIIFDGNAQDFHIGLDDSVDDLVIGVGSVLGTTQAVGIDESANVTITNQLTAGGQLALFSRTAVQLQTLAPAAAGAIVYCSNCTAALICISSGTGAGAWVEIADKTATCDD